MRQALKTLESEAPEIAAHRDSVCVREPATSAGDNPQVRILRERREEADEQLVTPEVARQIREANRELARLIPEGEHERLVQEHRALTLKKLTEGLSRSEQRDLTYTRWQLDRIEDAAAGEHLDYLEDLAETNADFAQHVNQLVDELRSFQMSQPRTARPAGRRRG
jgi:hypothetical protein